MLWFTFINKTIKKCKIRSIFICLHFHGHLNIQNNILLYKLFLFHFLSYSILFLVLRLHLSFNRFSVHTTFDVREIVGISKKVSELMQIYLHNSLTTLRHQVYIIVKEKKEAMNFTFSFWLGAAQYGRGPFSIY